MKRGCIARLRNTKRYAATCPTAIEKAILLEKTILPGEKRAVTLFERTVD
jgi:hypothetical protein